MHIISFQIYTILSSQKCTLYPLPTNTHYIHFSVLHPLFRNRHYINFTEIYIIDSTQNAHYTLYPLHKNTLKFFSDKDNISTSQKYILYTLIKMHFSHKHTISSIQNYILLSDKHDKSFSAHNKSFSQIYTVYHLLR